MNDYELLYYIYQNDEEALEILMKKYARNMICTIRKVMSGLNYVCETSDEFKEMIHLLNLELYQAVFSYRDDGKCSFGVYVNKCFEIGIKKYIRHRRSKECYQLSSAVRLDDKIKEEGNIYKVDALPSRNNEYDGQKICKWYYEANIIDYLSIHLKDIELKVAKKMIEGYTQMEISYDLKISYKQVHYIRNKIKNLLLRYID